MKIKRRKLSGVLVSLLTGFVIWSFGPGVTFAQTETGQITVKAVDPQGAVVPGATVNIKSVTTNAEKTATTNEEGVATVTNLQPGVYDVTVTSSGFACFQTAGAGNGRRQGECRSDAVGYGERRKHHRRCGRGRR